MAGDESRREKGLRSVAAALSPAMPVIALLVVALLSLTPPSPDPRTGETPAKGAFGTGRALAHLRHVAAAPHPTASAANEAVASYITDCLLELGGHLSPQTTETYGRPLHNVVARLTGSDSTGALLIVAHYDSRPVGPGAGDNGAAVAALLETLRALRHGPPLRNDVIALFTDGEELGLFGAREFARAHPWRHDVAVVLNFDARGCRGPSLMFETSPDAGDLVRLFAAEVTAPVSSSLMASVYELMPNSTDFTVFRGRGWRGLNFAFIGGFEAYHTALDTVDRLDRRSLAHHGDAMLALARALGGEDLRAAQPEPVVWFNIAGDVMVCYPAGWTTPLTVAFVVLYLLVLGAGWRRAGLDIRGWLRGVRAWLRVSVALTLCAVVMCHGGLLLLGGYRVPPLLGNTLADEWLFAAVALAGVALGSHLLRGCRARADEIVLGGMVPSVLGLMVLTVWIPGATPLFVWPALAVLSVLGVAFLRCVPPGSGIYAAALVPLLTAWVPVLHLFFQALTVAMVPVVMPLLAWVLVLAWPVVRPWARGSSLVFGMAGAVAAIVTLTTGGGAAATW